MPAESQDIERPVLLFHNNEFGNSNLLKVIDKKNKFILTK